MDSSLRDYRVLITGATGGIGLSLVEKLAEHNAVLVLADVDAARTTALADRVSSLGGRAYALPGNLADARYSDSLPNLAHELMGGLVPRFT